MSYDAPFAGLKVVDLSQGVAGPYAAMLLAQYGADVIKVEPPEGDWARALGKRYGDLTAFSIAANLGKRAIVLDLKTDEGRATARKLAAGADVFLESFRPGVAARLGVGYPDVAALSPRVIYLSVSGFGQTGPDAERPAVDTVFQAFTGIMSVNRGGDGIPHRVQADGAAASIVVSDTNAGTGASSPQHNTVLSLLSAQL
jgi:crotonobetainyl-CoA:carnitine CoA-transferase CaiB-like acyl-CoA transferase